MSQCASELYQGFIKPTFYESWHHLPLLRGRREEEVFKARYGRAEEISPETGRFRRPDILPELAVIQK